MEEIGIHENASKQERYQSLESQIRALVGGETNAIANMANITAALRETFGFFWVGFYLCDSESELVLGPFQGTVACSRIKFGSGVCGLAWQRGKTIIVPNVDDFQGHIACSSKSKSEIVVPALENNKVVALLDIDSDTINSFDEIDKIGLENIVSILF